jgi:hypothetical protein
MCALQKSRLEAHKDEDATPKEQLVTGKFMIFTLKQLCTQTGSGKYSAKVA